MELTEKQKKWIITNFKNTKNDEIMLKIGIKHSALHRFANENGLKKTKQFQSKCQLEATEFARLANKRNNWPPKGYKIPKSDENCFKKGHSGVVKWGAKRERERIEKSAAARRKTVLAEKRRVLFGLPQKTKLKVVPSPRIKISYRHLMRKRGYVVLRGSSEVYYTESTKRSITTEINAFQKCRIHVKPLITA